jgi:membrane protein
LETGKLQKLYLDLNHLTGDRLEVLRDALSTFAAARAPQAAASLGYYALFSLFPLLLFLVIIGSYFIDSSRVYFNVVYSVEQVIPASRQLIEENLQHVLEQRGSVGILVLVTLIWSASGVFTNLAYNINLAWKEAPARNFLDRYLVGLGIVGVLSALLLTAIGLDWFVHLLPLVDRLGSTSAWDRLWPLLSEIASWVVVFLMFMALYLWIPTVPISHRAALWAALTASLGWKLATAGFNLYLKSGLNRYQLVYGSLGAIIALLFLIYLISLISLFGAHLAAAIDRRVKLIKREKRLLRGV